MESRELRNAEGTRSTLAHDHCISLEALAAHFKLPVSELRDYGCREDRRGGDSRVAIPYLDESGATLVMRYRLRLQKAAAERDGRFRWRSGDKAKYLYGLDRLESARSKGRVLIVEGESDCWVAWHYGVPAVGVPGKANWHPSMASHLVGLEVFVWQEPEAEDFTQRIARDMASLRVIVAPDGIKDIADAHIAGRNVATLLEELCGAAPTYAEAERRRREAALPDLREKAREVLEHADPVELVKEALAATYGGDVRAPLLLSLAADTRLLVLRPGSTPCHVLVFGVASIGKSYAAAVMLALLPDEAKHVIEAGSPRVLIYDDADLRHRLLVFGESDSLPAGEDNPAASAIRGLLQENRLRYQTTVRDEGTGDFCVCEIDRPGPTAFLTTSTRRLGSQLDTRLFTLEVPDDATQIRAALEKQAALELGGQPVVPYRDALIAYESYLQAVAPWDVLVPYAETIVDYLKAQPVEPRVTRDFSKLLSLIKAVAIRRHVHRQRDGSGRLVATIDDYATVYELVASTYAASASGAGEKVREVVEAVATLAAAGGEPVRQADIARRIGKSRSTVSGHVTQAIAGGWLANAETTQGRPARLRIGEPLPDNAGLPTPQQLAELFDRSQCSVEGANDSSAMGAGTFADCSGVRPSTESRAEVGSSHVRHREEL